MFVSEASVAHVCNFEEESIVELYMDAFPSEDRHIDSVLNIREFIVSLRRSRLVEKLVDLCIFWAKRLILLEGNRKTGGLCLGKRRYYRWLA
jgi:hypothetical protein